MGMKRNISILVALCIVYINTACLQLKSPMTLYGGNVYFYLHFQPQTVVYHCMVKIQ